MKSRIRILSGCPSVELCCLLLLLLPAVSVAQTTVLTVGVCGTFDDIQDAIDAAAVGSETEIRIQGDATYQENLLFSKFFTAGSIEMTGGWDCLFSNWAEDPSATVIDGAGTDAVARVRIGGGELVLRRFTVTNGEAEKGAGIQILLDGGARVELQSLRVIDNRSVSSGSVHGGGVSADIDGTEVLEISDLLVRDNLAISRNQAVVYGAGLSIMASGDARFLVEHSTFEGNRIENVGGDDALGAGVHLETNHNARGELRDSDIFDNAAIGDVRVASGIYIESGQSGDALVERTTIMRNSIGGTAAGAQLRARAKEVSSITIRDSGVLQGESDGIYAYVIDSGKVHMVNLTVADHTSTGLHLAIYELGAISLYNTISFGNLVDLQAPAKLDDGANLIGVNPLFVDAVNLDYHLEPGTAAEDAGENDPPGGLGVFDLDGTPRILNGIVDIGMYEGVSVVFADGFETGDCRYWSSQVP